MQLPPVPVDYETPVPSAGVNPEAAGRAVRSADQIFAIRLARTLGFCLMLFGALYIFLMCTMWRTNPANSQSVVNSIVLMVLLGAGFYVMPGVVLANAAFNMEREGGKEPAIAMLAGCIWSILSLSTATVAHVIIAFSTGRWIFAMPQGVADVCLLIGVSLLIHRVSRILHLEKRRGF